MSNIGNILVDPAKMRETASYVRGRNEKLNETLTEIRKEILALESSYKSRGSTEMQRKINAFSTKHFPQFKTVVDSYAKFLDDTANMTENLDITIEKNANSKFQEP
jgi:uncharacterized protein YukE